MRRWKTLSVALVCTERVVSTSTEATPGRDGRAGSTTRPSVSLAGTWSSATEMTSGHTTTSNPQITPLFTSSTATDPSASVSSTEPVSPPLFRLPLKAPERMSVSGSQRQLIVGSAPLSGSIRASMLMVLASGCAGGREPPDEAQDPIQGLFQLAIGNRVAQPHPAVV